MSYLLTLPQRVTSYRFLNTIGNTRSNISAHYDISNEMFEGLFANSVTTDVCSNHNYRVSIRRHDIFVWHIR